MKVIDEPQLEIEIRKAEKDLDEARDRYRTAYHEVKIAEGILYKFRALAGRLTPAVPGHLGNGNGEGTTPKRRRRRGTGSGLAQLSSEDEGMMEKILVEMRHSEAESLLEIARRVDEVKVKSNGREGMTFACYNAVGELVKRGHLEGPIGTGKRSPYKITPYGIATIERVTQ